MGANPGLLGEKPATNSLSYGTAYWTVSHDLEWGILVIVYHAITNVVKKSTGFET
jgi:hypothetical protein